MKLNKKMQFHKILLALVILALTASCDNPKLFAVVTTTPITNITLSTATSGGFITDDNNAKVTSQGVCWSTKSNPTISDSKTTGVTVTAIFTSTITGLLPNTTYYVRAYLTNRDGTVYGNEVSFTTPQGDVLALTTATPTAIAATTATAGGNITSDGGSTVTARGVCWNTSATPTISNSKTTDGNGTGTFTSSLTGLLPATVYYVRAYATNATGTVYGNEVTFTTTQAATLALTTTAPSGIATTAATAGGNITSDGGLVITARGVCWSTSTAPTISNSKTTDGNGTGVFTSNLTGLQPNTKYYLRAYATNLSGTTYGNEVSFTTAQTAVLTLTTTTPTAIGLNTATAGGNVTSDGGSTVTARGVCWSTSAGPTISNSKTTDGNGTGAFTSSLIGLLSGTTYYLRAYATNATGTAYGNEVSFTTTQLAVPTLTTTGVTAIALTTATAGGNVTSDGGSTVTARGVCWNTATTPTISNSKTADGTGTGAFTSSLTGLLSGTTYYLRAYATNAIGTAYGNEVSFTTTAAVVNTAGTLTVSALTSSAGGSYAPRNIMAIWIENSSGVFVKTSLAYAAARIQYLTNWVSNSSKNVVDATTGATLSSHATRTATWNATNVSGVVVPDGTYKVCMELTDKNGTGNFSTFTFTKGPAAVTLTPTNVASFSNISIVWTPK
ncbi:MAG TPA: DUF2271 domain-containing protein [Paludibacter sp.]|nr:DUF2271 domain-containing protein [Paludibacter sp.]